jgi:hypothetical protein
MSPTIPLLDQFRIVHQKVDVLLPASCSYVQLAMKATPYRKDFYTRLGGPDAEVELKAWLEGLEKIVKQMEDAYKANGWGTI